MLMEMDCFGEHFNCELNVFMRKCVGFTQVLICAAGSRLCTLNTVLSLVCLQISYLILCSWSVAAAHRGSPVLLCPGTLAQTRCTELALTCHYIHAVLARMSLSRASPPWLPAHANSHTSCVRSAVIPHSCVFIHNWSSPAVVTRCPFMYCCV